MKRNYQEGIYVTDGLDFATYLIERGVPYVRSIWDGRDMAWAFKAIPEIETHWSHWIGRQEVRICPRSYMETRQSLITEIKGKTK